MKKTWFSGPVLPKGVCKMTVIYNLRLVRSIMGWMLVPNYLTSPTEGIEEILNKFYGDNWASMSASSRCFAIGEPVEKAVQHIKTVFRELEIPFSLCGNRQLPTIRVWWNPVSTYQFKNS